MKCRQDSIVMPPPPLYCLIKVQQTSVRNLENGQFRPRTASNVKVSILEAAAFFCIYVWKGKPAPPQVQGATWDMPLPLTLTWELDPTEEGHTRKASIGDKDPTQGAVGPSLSQSVESWVPQEKDIPERSLQETKTPPHPIPSPSPIPSQSQRKELLSQLRFF